MSEFILIPRNYWRLAAILALAFGALFVLAEWTNPDPILLGRLRDGFLLRGPETSVQDQIYAFYRPLVHKITDPSFTNDDNEVFTVAGEPRIKSPMGKKIIILTVDSRPRDKVGELLAKGPLKFASTSASAFGALNHYLYALIHGYDYRYVQAPEFTDRHGTWVKVPVVQEALLTHDVAVFMDGDVGVHYPHVPLEWLMNHWNITDDTIVAAPLDVHQFDNFNERGELSLNTGFLLGQAGPRTQELFQQWLDCPLELTDLYANCSQWAYNWAHEQAAFRDYIHHKFARPEDVVTIPCVEANGSPDNPDGSQPGGEGSNCTGQFIRHYWMDKSLMKREFTDSVMPYIVSRLHESLMQGSRQSAVVYGHERELGQLFDGF